MCLPLLAVVCLLTYVSAQPSSFIEHDSIVFPNTDNDTVYPNISNMLARCIGDDKIEYHGECHKLLEVGQPCPDNHWLILDLYSASLPKPWIRGKCVHKPCPESKVYWAPFKKCFKSNETANICPIGNILDTDYFGDGICVCKRDPVHGKDNNGACYPVYTRGPCKWKEVWARTNGEMACIDDRCYEERKPGKTVVPWGKNCYALDERGPCDQGKVVSINSVTFTPYCKDPLAPLHLLGPPCAGADHTGNCNAAVKVQTNSFLIKVAEQASKKRTKKNVEE